MIKKFYFRKGILSIAFGLTALYAANAQMLFEYDLDKILEDKRFYTGCDSSFIDALNSRSVSNADFYVKIDTSHINSVSDFYDIKNFSYDIATNTIYANFLVFNNKMITESPQERNSIRRIIDAANFNFISNIAHEYDHYIKIKQLKKLGYPESFEFHNLITLSAALEISARFRENLFLRKSVMIGKDINKAYPDANLRPYADNEPLPEYYYYLKKTIPGDTISQAEALVMLRSAANEFFNLYPQHYNKEIVNFAQKNAGKNAQPCPFDKLREAIDIIFTFNFNGRDVVLREFLGNDKFDKTLKDVYSLGKYKKMKKIQKIR
ncbi:MAG: hypothetical protein LBJ18_02565 [Rickettsiales bacterium]|jgi:hypothetical protein|nr:hypothetical protein [Rickettsiales bacterium]